MGAISVRDVPARKQRKLPALSGVLKTGLKAGQREPHVWLLPSTPLGPPRHFGDKRHFGDRRLHVSFGVSPDHRPV